jgi:hypothetical protein
MSWSRYLTAYYFLETPLRISGILVTEHSTLNNKASRLSPRRSIPATFLLVGMNNFGAENRYGMK